MSERGFTLVEVLIALAITGVVLLFLLPTFFTYMDANTRNEVRTGGIAAAQQVVETVRRMDPETLPNTGNSGIQVVQVGDRNFEAITRYCATPSYCTPSSRHLTIEVSHGGELIYTVETVYTQLR